MTMNDFQKQAIIIAMKKMFKQDWFDICTIDKCIKIIGGIPDKDDYNALSVLHCIHWNEMEVDFRNLVMMKCLQILESPRLDVGIVEDLFKNELNRLTIR